MKKIELIKNKFNNHNEFDKTYYNANVRVKSNIVITLGVLVKQAEIEVVTSGFLKPDLVRTSEGK